MFPGGIANIQWNHFPDTSQNFPRRVQSSFPRKSWNPSPQAESLSPVDSGSSSLAEYKCISPSIFRRLSPQESNRVILSKLQRKDHPQRSSFYPQRSSSKSPIELINETPSGVIVKISAKHLSPQSNSPQSNLFTRVIPQRSYLLLQVYSCNHLCSSSPAEPKNSILFSSKLSGIYFPQLKHYISIHHDTCINASYHTISFMLRTSLLDPYYALYMTDLYLSGRTQLNSQPYQKPSLVQLNRFLKIFLMPIQSKKFQDLLSSS